MVSKQTDNLDFGTSELSSIAYILHTHVFCRFLNRVICINYLYLFIGKSYFTFQTIGKSSSGVHLPIWDCMCN